MTYQTTQFHFISADLRRRIDLFFAEQGQGFNAAGLVRQRLSSILMMDALTDSELAAMDLKRTDILPFVFEDCFAPTEQPSVARKSI